LLPLVEPKDDRERTVLARLRAWNFEMTTASSEATVFAVWLRELTRLVCADELGETYESASAEREEFLINVLSDTSRQARWCDDMRTPGIESCAEMAGRAFRDSLAFLDRHRGADVDDWSWGKLHRARSRHQAFGDLPLLGRFFDIETPAGGDNQTVNLG